MKSTAWKKNYLVILHSDFDNTWHACTIPCTFLQAIRFIQVKQWNPALHNGNVRIATLAEFAALPKREVTA